MIFQMLFGFFRRRRRVLCGGLIFIAVLFSALENLLICRLWRNIGTLPLSHVRLDDAGVHKDQNSQWTPRMDVLGAEEASKYQNVFTNLSLQDSTVELEEPKTVYRVGEVIRVKITIQFNPNKGYNHGRDNIRIRMVEDLKGASVSGYVIDHHNGSYTGVLKALWEGNCIIMVALKYTLYEISYLYYSRQQLRTVRLFKANFINGKQVISSPCHPRPNSLDGSYGLCNLTKQNGGLPWFCQIPKEANMTCKHLHHISQAAYGQDNILARTLPHSRVWSNETRVLGENISVLVQGDVHMKQQNNKQLCNKYNLSALWEQPSPTGHFYRHNWYPYHCKAASVPYTRCVKNKYFIFYGDSTLGRQWYEDMRDRFNCTEYLINETQLKTSKCHDHNMILYPSRHNFPIHSLKLTPKVNLVCKNLEDLLDMVSKDYLPVIAVHIYLHYVYFHQSIYTKRIRHLRTTLETILRKRPDAKIVIKGPFAIRSKTVGTNDYYAYIYRLILIEELFTLRSRIIYLDHMDISNAAQTEIHPTKEIVREVVNLMLAYVCE